VDRALELVAGGEKVERETVHWFHFQRAQVLVDMLRYEDALIDLNIVNESGIVGDWIVDVWKLTADCLEELGRPGEAVVALSNGFSSGMDMDKQWDLLRAMDRVRL
jgi:hypothetical protein